MDLALEVEAGPPIAQKLGKMLAQKTWMMDFESALEFSGATLAVIRTSQDRLEGPRAFAEKRPPRFTGY
jgi:enoyl-CoA hydratase/carnithine racemase